MLRKALVIVFVSMLVLLAGCTWPWDPSPSEVRQQVIAEQTAAAIQANPSRYKPIKDMTPEELAKCQQQTTLATPTTQVCPICATATTAPSISTATPQTIATSTPAPQATQPAANIPCTSYVEANYPQKQGSSTGYTVQMGGGNDQRQVNHVWWITKDSKYHLEEFVIVPYGVAGVDLVGETGMFGEVRNFPRTCAWKNLVQDAVNAAREKGRDHATGRVWLMADFVRYLNGDANAKPLVSDAFALTPEQITALADPTSQ